MLCIRYVLQLPVDGEKKPPTGTVTMLFQLKNPPARLASQRGFSLLELLIVVIIAGILAGIAMSGLAAIMPKQRLNAAANLLRSDMLEAKGRASAIMRDVGVGPNVAKTEWSVQLFDATPMASGTVFQGVTRELSQFEGVTFDTFPNVVFNPNGTARQSYTVILKHPTAGTRTITVSLTGKIRIL